MKKLENTQEFFGIHTKTTPQKKKIFADKINKKNHANSAEEAQKKMKLRSKTYLEKLHHNLKHACNAENQKYS